MMPPPSRLFHLLLLFFCLIFSSGCSAYKILVYSPKFSHSHSNFMGRIADILVEEGHEVTTLIPALNPELKDGTSKSRIIRVPPDARALAAGEEMNSATSEIDMFTVSFNVFYAFIMGRKLASLFCPQCETTLAHPGLLEQLRDEHFDLVINENFDFCGLGLGHALGVKATIVVSSCTLFDNVAYDLGVPVVPSYNPSFVTSELDSSLWSRARNVLFTYYNQLMWEPVLKCSEASYREKYGDAFPGMRKLTSDAAFVFTNSEPLVDFARPLLRKVVDLGGIGVQKPVPLDEHWQKVLSLRNATVLVSFGSIMKSSKMSIERKRALLTTMSRFPNVTFIWKYETPEDIFAKGEAGKVPNVVLSKWTPQNDLLNDGRMTAFISHAGQGSCHEAANAGVPGLFIPLFGDQPRNAAVMEHAGIGIAFSKFDADDAEKLTAAVTRLLYTESLHVTANKTSRMLSRRPFSPRELLVKHVEFAAEFGSAKSLTPRGLQLGWIQYFLVDVIAAALLALTLAVIIAFFICRCFLRSIIKRMSYDKVKKA